MEYRNLVNMPSDTTELDNSNHPESLPNHMRREIIKQELSDKIHADWYVASTPCYLKCKSYPDCLCRNYKFSL